ncbi:hypothetical protein CF65_00138 [Aggregatibacter actinomycetemcomitans HK1651]|nr:hypothetical protein CF65_00138 [Aggregatibacter actinomycetemcomitans HK1651]
MLCHVFSDHSTYLKVRSILAQNLWFALKRKIS